MSLSKLFAAACLALTLTACGGTDAGEEPLQSEDLSSVEQGQGMPPACPIGENVFYWDEIYGACGSCTASRKPGQLATRYAACTGNVSGTKTLINVRQCITPCELQ